MTTVQELKIQLLPRLRRAFKERGCFAIVQFSLKGRYRPADLLVGRDFDHAFVEIVKQVRATDIEQLTRSRTPTHGMSRSSATVSRGQPSKQKMGTPGGVVFLSMAKMEASLSQWGGEIPFHCEIYDETSLDVLTQRLAERVLPMLDERRRGRELEAARSRGTARAPGRAPGGCLARPPDPVDSSAFDSMVFIARDLLHDGGQSVEYELNLAEDEFRHRHDVASCLHLARTVEALLLGLVREWDASGGAGIFERVQSLQNQLHEIQAELAKLSLAPASEAQSETPKRLPPKGRQLIEDLFELYRSSGTNEARTDGKNPPSINAAYHSIKRRLSRFQACRDIFKELDSEEVIQKIVADRNAIAHVRDVALPGDDHRRANRMLTLSQKLFDAMARLDIARKAALPLIG